MPIEGFDYKEFAQSMSEQAVQLVPQEFNDNQREYIVKTLGNFTLLAGEALYNDASLNLNVEQAVLITQIIAEWSFHKSVDLVRSGILPEYWDSIMQKIAFTIFEIAKQAIIRNLPQEQLLQAVEHHVIKVYKESIDELQSKGLIDEETKARAQSQSNIDAMAQMAQEAQREEQQRMAEESARNAEIAQQKREERQAQRRAEKEAAKGAQANATNLPAVQGNGGYAPITHKQMKLMSLALVMKILSQDKANTILNKFDAQDSNAITQYMGLANLESQLDGDLVTGCLEEIRKYLPIKRKLTQDNLAFEMNEYFKKVPRDRIERVIKSERPLVKRFLSKAYDGEFDTVPLKVAGVIAEYIGENI